MSEKQILTAYLLGEPQFIWQDEPLTKLTGKNLALLCYLTLQEKPVSRSHIAELLWKVGKGDNVRVALYALRKQPGAQTWLSLDDDLVFVHARSDVQALQQAVEQAEYQTALHLLPQLLSPTLPFLEQLKVRGAPTFDNWLDIERYRVTEWQQMFLMLYATSLLEEQRPHEAQTPLQQLLKQDPLNEHAHRQLIHTYHEDGNTEAALAQFEELRQTLQDELGVEPVQETLELLREIEGTGLSQNKRALLLHYPDDVPQQPSKLIGRDALLLEAKQQLDKGQRVLLQGFGGAGKTAIAARLAVDHLTPSETSNKVPKVLWLEAGYDSFDVVSDALAQALEMQERLSRSGQRASELHAILVEKAVTLIVLDDMWSAYTLSQLLPAIPAKTHLLITSQQRYPKLKRLDVGKLERPAALKLLNHYAQADLEEDDYASELCILLGDHAFALRIAGVTLHVESIGVKKLYAQIKHTPHTLKLPEAFTEDKRETVVQLLQVSLQSLEDPAHEAFFAMGALFAPSCTPEFLALMLRRDLTETENALRDLHHRALVDRQAEPGSDVIAYRLHNLAFAYSTTNSTLRPSTTINAAHKYIAAYHQHLEHIEADIPNLLGALEQHSSTQDHTFFLDSMQYLIIHREAYYKARGHTPKSLTLLERALAYAQQDEAHELGHLFAARLGDAYRELHGNSQRALKVYHIALDMAQLAANTHYKATLHSLIGVTLFQAGQSNFEGHMQQAYQLSKQHDDYLALAQVLQNLGYISGMQEDYQAAHHYSHEAVDAARHLYKPYTEQTQEMSATAEAAKTDVAQILFFALLNLGEAEKMLGRTAAALGYKQEALELATTQDNHLWQAHAFHEIAETYHYNEQPELAAEFYTEALVLYQKNHAYHEVNLIEKALKDVKQR